MEVNATRTYDEWTARLSLAEKSKALVRDGVLRLLGAGRRIDASSNWIRFIYYHHVFDDERAGFLRQLRHLGNFGQFLSLGDAAGMLENDTPIDGRYFCLTFDDGFKSCISGALPILAEQGIPAAFYLVTSMIGVNLAPGDGKARCVFGFKGKDTSLEFLTWDDCRAMIDAGMTIGSHTHTHLRMADADAAPVATEMAESKTEIESRLGMSCNHFCAPYGIPGVDFDLSLQGQMAQAAGYRSFATGKRGVTRMGGDPYAILRDQILAGWGDHQLNYFLSTKR